MEINVNVNVSGTITLNVPGLENLVSGVASAPVKSTKKRVPDAKPLVVGIDCDPETDVITATVATEESTTRGVVATTAVAKDLQGNAETVIVPATEATTVTNTLTLEEVRAAAAVKTKAGKREEVKALLTKLGAASLPVLDPSKYAEFLNAVNAL